ncbi:hypothetical protein Gotur_003004 [Gossypium turneri]
MASWKKTIATPFRKACTFFNQQPRDKKSQTVKLINRFNFRFDFSLTMNNKFFYGCTAEHEKHVMDLHGEVMACAYEDVQVMWSILDKSKSTACNIKP